MQIHCINDFDMKMAENLTGLRGDRMELYIVSFIYNVMNI